MNDYYVTFRSLTSAQRASFEASKHGIRAELIRTPKSLSSTGCGYALRVDQIFIQNTVKILRNGNLAYGLDKNLVKYRRVAQSLSSNKLEAIRRIWNLYRKAEKLSVIYSAYNFVFWAFRAVLRRI